MKSIKRKREMKENKELNNEVTISDDKHPSIYAWSILIRLQPRIYNKYKCIKIKVVGNLLGVADWLVKLFYNSGIEEISREKKDMAKGDGYIFKDAYEIILKKRASIDYTEEDEEYWKEIEKYIVEEFNKYKNKKKK